MRDLESWTSCAAPDPDVLEGRFVRLERYDRARHGDALWKAFGGTAVNDLIRYFPNGPFEDAAGLTGWLDGVQGNWRTMVYRRLDTGEVCGMASYMRIDAANGVVEVGSIAHAPSIQRSPVSTEAQYLMARHVFDDLGYRRYEWKLNNLNQPSHAAARRFGFTFEGVFRQHIVAKGQNRDTAWYSMLDHEWPAIRNAFEAWLDPVNFDEAGVQKKRLKEFRGA